MEPTCEALTQLGTHIAEIDSITGDVAASAQEPAVAVEEGGERPNDLSIDRHQHTKATAPKRPSPTGMSQTCPKDLKPFLTIACRNGSELGRFVASPTRPCHSDEPSVLDHVFVRDQRAATAPRFRSLQLRPRS